MSDWWSNNQRSHKQIFRCKLVPTWYQSRVLRRDTRRYEVIGNIAFSVKKSNQRIRYRLYFVSIGNHRYKFNSSLLLISVIKICRVQIESYYTIDCGKRFLKSDSIVIACVSIWYSIIEIVDFSYKLVHISQFLIVLIVFFDEKLIAFTYKIGYIALSSKIVGFNNRIFENCFVKLGFIHQCIPCGFWKFVAEKISCKIGLVNIWVVCLFWFLEKLLWRSFCRSWLLTTITLCCLWISWVIWTWMKD